jgi:hypothetical protein
MEEAETSSMAVLPEIPAVEGVRSLEVRWILPGQLEAAVARWFGRYPAATESQEDAYLLQPYLRGLSVKIRGGGALEVKMYHGSQGTLDVERRAHGHFEYWQKWSFPFAPLSQGSSNPTGWRLVHKRRRISRFMVVGGRAQAGLPRLGEEPGCAVELTEVHMDGKAWWTLGFEATGAESLLRSGLEATAALVFAQALPGGTELGTDDSKSYAEWLGRPPGAEKHGADGCRIC